MRIVNYHPKVPAEVRLFIDHYDAISSDLGAWFWLELTEATSYACEYPERRHFDHTGLRRSNLKRFPIHFLYRILSGAIHTTAVRHDRQDSCYGSRRQ